MSNNYLDFLAAIKNEVVRVPEVSISEKALPYGQQLRFTRGEETVILSIYNGKRGIKTVWGGANDDLREALSTQMESLLIKYTGVQPAAKQLPACSILEECAGFTGTWAGSDESGKGDFFGPLVVAAVAVNKAVAERLRVAGVKDCKLLSDKEILRLEPIIKAIALEFVVLSMKPEIYNYRYAQLRLQNKNLNNLLAAGHVAAIDKLLAAEANCKMVLVDQFSQNSGIKRALIAKYPEVIVIEKTKAEEDIAVAAASILARANFLSVMQELSVIAGYELPKGGGAQATKVAKLLSEQQGLPFLDKLVKKHFANYKKIN
ncbi:MAG TPA: ribonuclease HIII [Candidatus Avacidaminococcus intestinavium]|uniref:Ribonuclease n=1 Tax=Candidatus Avacidaminococcus intestinavium TaxID=2840684 RepID=A0A9D1MQF4_9FIRM|nr:ribonuclease HIII [Candidatus Avacidaminococcus intestinavium]